MFMNVYECYLHVIVAQQLSFIANTVHTVTYSVNILEQNQNLEYV